MIEENLKKASQKQYITKNTKKVRLFLACLLVLLALAGWLYFCLEVVGLGTSHIIGRTISIRRELAINLSI